MNGKQYLGIYLRLSLEDRDTGNGRNRINNESNSISSQRKQILEYIAKRSDWAEYETVEFCDDGYSGTNMERPGMQKLLGEIKKNQIACVIVKDMSRFSRDYIELGIVETGRSDELSAQLAELSARLKEREQECSDIEDKCHQQKQEMKQIIRYSGLEELTQEVVDV